MSKSKLTHTAPPANDLDNVVSIGKLRADRQERDRRARGAEVWMPPERALIVALLRALSLSNRRRDQRLLMSIRWELARLNWELGAPDGCATACEILNIATRPRT